MSHLVLLSRDLPLPPVQAGGRTVTFQTALADAAFPAGARVYCTTAVDRVDSALIERLPADVGLIANLGVGVDNIDLAAAAARGILVSNTPVVTEDTADHAFALILATMRKIPVNDRFAREGKWSPVAPMAAMGARVHGKTIGIIGFGAIGQAVARRAKGFGLHAVYFSRTPKRDAERETGAVRAGSVDALLAVADIVSLHAPLTPETRRMIDGPRLAQFKPGAVLINTARGALVDAEALAEALASGRLAGAGLDVFENEPEIPQALLAFQAVVVTPHIGSATAECRMDIVRRGLVNIVSFLESGAPLDRVSLS